MEKLTTVIAGMIMSVCAVAEPPPARDSSTDYVQAWLGALDTAERLTITGRDAGDDLIGDLGTLPYGGGAGLRLWGNGTFRFGYEGGGLISWKSHETGFFASSSGGRGTLVVATDLRYFSLGTFMGALAAADLTPNLRLLLSAGPSLTWARLDPQHDAPVAEPSGTVDIDSDDTASDVSFVPYVRAGLEIVLSEDLTLGASVRYADDEFDFGGGKLDVDEVMWLFTIGSRL